MYTYSMPIAPRAAALALPLAVVLAATALAGTPTLTATTAEEGLSGLVQSDRAPLAAASVYAYQVADLSRQVDELQGIPGGEDCRPLIGGWLRIYFYF